MLLDSNLLIIDADKKMCKKRSYAKKEKLGGSEMQLSVQDRALKLCPDLQHAILMFAKHSSTKVIHFRGPGTNVKLLSSVKLNIRVKK